MEKKSKKDSPEGRLMGQIPLEDEFKGLGAFRSVISRLLHACARYLPMYPQWRVTIHRIRGVHVGRGVFIGSDVFIDNTYPESVIIEDFVTIISRSFIIGHNFVPMHLKNILQDSSSNSGTGVVLEKGCYLGAQTIVMPGVTIGCCAIVGAGSIVTEDIPPYTLALGVPAKVLRTFDKCLVNL